MSTRQIGNGHENKVMEMAEALGYACFAARGSRGPVDVVCFVDNKYPMFLTPLVIQVGTKNKPIAATLNELDAAPRPIGSKCIVARRHCKGSGHPVIWSFHTSEGKFDSLESLLARR